MKKKTGRAAWNTNPPKYDWVVFKACGCPKDFIADFEDEGTLICVEKAMRQGGSRFERIGRSTKRFKHLMDHFSRVGCEHQPVQQSLGLPEAK